jgi:hypothetical protein
MRIGQGLTLITIGAILAFAVRKDSDLVDIQVMGLILMVVGAAAIIANQKVWERRREAALLPQPMDDTLEPDLPLPPSQHHTTMRPTLTK